MTFDHKPHCRECNEEIVDACKLCERFLCYHCDSEDDCLSIKGYLILEREVNELKKENEKLKKENINLQKESKNLRELLKDAKNNM